MRCIYCSSSRRSKEHLFPASLGGRQTNKNILCVDCNSKLSSLDQSLSNFLRPFSALIQPIRDHNKNGISVPATLSGRSVILEPNGSILHKPSPVPITLKNDEHGRPSEITFACRKSFELWKAQSNFNGKIVKESIRKSTHNNEFYISGKLEDETVFRAMAKIGLNYIAHTCPHLASTECFSSVKKYITGEIGEPPANFGIGWLMDTSFWKKNNAKHKFCHQVALVSSAGRIRVFIQLYGHLHSYMEFRSEKFQSTSSTIYAIDPLSRRQDPIDARGRSVRLDQRKLKSLKTTPNILLIRSQMKDFSNAAGIEFNRRVLAPTYHLISAPNTEWSTDSLVKALDCHDSYIARLIAFVMKDAPPPLSTIINTAPFDGSDRTESENPIFRGMVELTKSLMAHEIRALLDSKSFNLEYFLDLIGGQRGQEIVISLLREVLSPPFLRSVTQSQ